MECQDGREHIPDGEKEHTFKTNVSCPQHRLACTPQKKPVEPSSGGVPQDQSGVRLLVRSLKVT